MKPVKWTKEKVIELSSLYKGPSEFKKHNPSAYKALRRYGLLAQLYPINKRERKPEFTKETLVSLMKTCSSRSDFQKKHGSAYNAARKLNLISIVFPKSKRYDLFDREPYTNEELISKASQYSTIKEWAEKESGSYQVACRRGIVDKYGPKPLEGTSTQELELLQWLKTISSDFKTKRFGNDYEIDCYSERLKLGIEYNGFYWHQEDKLGRSYHRKKTEYFKNIGIRLIHIWEDEWKNRQAQVKDFIRSACGENKIRIGARKCEFIEIESSIARAFLDNTHIQRSANSIKLAIGCFYAEELIGVCTFGAHHRGGAEVVLNRFACKDNYTISGFLAKASKIAGNKFGRLISWADYSKSQGKGYLAAGWKIIKLHPPDYFYVDKNSKRVGKQSRRKSSVKTPDNMTESDHAKKDGLYKVWDCGKLLLEFNGVLK